MSDPFSPDAQQDLFVDEFEALREERQELLRRWRQGEQSEEIRRRVSELDRRGAYRATSRVVPPPAPAAKW